MKDYRSLDVVLVDFGDVEFSGEQGGVRPAVIIQNDKGNIHSSTTLVFPFSSKIKHVNQPTHSLIRPDNKNGLWKTSIVLGECLRQISEERILEKLGTITNQKDKDELKRVYYANACF